MSGRICSTKTFEAQQQKTYLWTCAPSEDSDQPSHSSSLISIFTRHVLDCQECQHFKRTTKTDSSLMSEGTFSHVAAH